MLYLAPETTVEHIDVSKSVRLTKQSSERTFGERIGKDSILPGEVGYILAVVGILDRSL
jgi:hypothetical protein